MGAQRRDTPRSGIRNRDVRRGAGARVAPFLVRRPVRAAPIGATASGTAPAPVTGWSGTEEGQGQRRGARGTRGASPALAVVPVVADRSPGRPGGCNAALHPPGRRSAAPGPRHPTVPSCCNDNITATGWVLGRALALPPPAPPPGVIPTFLPGVAGSRPPCSARRVTRQATAPDVVGFLSIGRVSGRRTGRRAEEEHQAEDRRRAEEEHQAEDRRRAEEEHQAQDRRRAEERRPQRLTAAPYMHQRGPARQATMRPYQRPGVL